MEDSDRDRLRYFLKDSVRLETDFSQTPQSLGEPPPPVEKPASEGASVIQLPAPGDWSCVADLSLVDAIGRRRSRRAFKPEPLSLDELSLLLWATQGLRRSTERGAVFRTVPSAGCRHAFETYLCVSLAQDLLPGVYRYLPVEHQLVLEQLQEDLPARLTQATLGQSFAGRAAVTFVWATIPYRMEWRYGQAAHKVIAIDVGHVCQNLYLACEAIGAGTCAIAAYHQELMDDLVGVDGRNEFVTYLAPVGKVGGTAEQMNKE